MDNEKVTDYSWKVHRSLLRRDLVAGVSRITFAIIIALTVYMVFGVRQYWFVGRRGRHLSRGTGVDQIRRVSG